MGWVDAPAEVRHPNRQPTGREGTTDPTTGIGLRGGDFSLCAPGLLGLARACARGRVNLGAQGGGVGPGGSSGGCAPTSRCASRGAGGVRCGMGAHGWAGVSDAPWAGGAAGIAGSVGIRRPRAQPIPPRCRRVRPVPPQRQRPSGEQDGPNADRRTRTRPVAGVARVRRVRPPRRPEGPWGIGQPPDTFAQSPRTRRTHRTRLASR